MTYPWCGESHKRGSGCTHGNSNLTHWGRMTHICVGKLTTIGSDNGLSPGRRQSIIWTIAGILLIWPLGTNFSEILIWNQTFSFKKMHLKMSSAKWRPFCLGLNVLIASYCRISPRLNIYIHVYTYIYVYISISLILPISSQWVLFTQVAFFNTINTNKRTYFNNARDGHNVLKEKRQHLFANTVVTRTVGQLDFSVNSLSQNASIIQRFLRANIN